MYQTNIIAKYGEAVKKLEKEVKEKEKKEAKEAKEAAKEAKEAAKEAKEAAKEEAAKEAAKEEAARCGKKKPLHPTPRCVKRRRKNQTEFSQLLKELWRGHFRRGNFFPFYFLFSVGLRPLCITSVVSVIYVVSVSWRLYLLVFRRLRLCRFCL